MKFRLLSLIACSLACSIAIAQDAAPAAPSQDSGNAQGGRGQGRGRFGGGMGMGAGVLGTVTEVAADHYKVKSESGEIYIVHFSVNTHFVKQPASPRGEGRGRSPGGQGTDAESDANPGAMRGGVTYLGPGMGRGNPPEPIKPTDIKVGDAVGAMGEIDASQKSVGAVVVMQLDPERAQQMARMQANYGKTWLMGKVTAIDGVKVTVAGSIDNRPLAFVADENTTFRKRRDPVTLADIEIGDTVRAEGALKDGIFTATTVNVMGAPPAGGPGGTPPPPPQ